MTASPVVDTSKGRVRGNVEDGIEVFLGIPYGAPTGGANRFRAPQPRSPWTGELDCTEYGPTCPQTVLVTKMSDAMRALRAPAPGAAPPAPGEDCLVLNVWTPDADDGARRPVMVWFHGGGYTTGSGSLRANRGTRLAQRGDVVVVSINNRLGPLGFLALGEIAGEEYADAGNAGLLDMVAALQWVHDEIARFGGDPDNVTLFGCSGGGGKVTTLLGTPAAAGLYHKAIVESGPMLHGVEPVDAAATTRAVMGALGLDDTQVKALHDVPVPELIAATQSILPDTLQRLLVDGDGHHFGPLVDGRILPQHMFDPVAAATAVDIPLVIGTNKDEIALFAGMIDDWEDWDPERHLDIVRAFARERYDDVRDVYSRSRPDANAGDLAIAAMSAPTRASTITLTERKLAAGDAPVYMYLFAFETDILGGRVKACHGLEVSFVFDLTDETPMTGSRPEKADVAAAMSTAWLAFARTGDPNHDGIPEWPRYDVDRRATMVFDTECHVEDDPLPEERVVWAGAVIKMD
jgi:para-nitrobenzyl esterase